MDRGSPLFPNAWTRSRRATLGLAAGAALAVGLLGPVSPALAASHVITSSGPLTRVEITTDLNCAVNHTGDSAGEFYDDTACATLVAVGGTLYGPASIPAGGRATPRTAFTPVSQSAVTGSGTSANPYRIVTVVRLGSSGLQITETDSYVVGQETYRTDVRIGNSGGSAVHAILYRAGDCYLQDSDEGFGAADAATGAVSCVASVAGSSPPVRGTRIEQWYPLSPGSYYEAVYRDVWAKIGTQTAFTNSCEQCANYIDNGAGLSWSVTIPAGGSVTKSHLTVFSPLGIVPLTTTKTAATRSVSAGASDSYTIKIANPGTTAATLTSITDTLPAGFTYTAGSTTGATTANPSVAGQVLTWNGTFTVPASGSLSLTFRVTVSTTPGTYTNQAGATGESPLVIVASGQTAPVTVVAPPSPSPSPSTSPSPSPSTSPSPSASPSPSLVPSPSPSPSLVPSPSPSPSPVASPTPKPTATTLPVVITPPPTSKIGATTGGSSSPLVPISIAMLLIAATGLMLTRRPKSR